uniref:WD_REPEATS_REGION domain-containing protein n=1 Tax=Steinernema glaseri TaxID=37863 RepID=A0A1I7Z0V5_9BILA
MMTLTSIDKASRLCMWTLKTLKQLFHSSVLSRNECFADLHVTVLTEVPNETNAFIVGCADGTVGKIIFETEENTKIETIASHNSLVTAIDVHPAPLNVYRGENVCNLALSASLDYTVMLTDMKKKLTLAVFEGHNEFVMDVKWHPTKPSVFASLDANGLVYLWDITGSLDYPMYELRLPNAAKKILWSHDGKRLIAGDSEGVVRVYNAHKRVWKARNSDWMLLDETAQLMANRFVYNATIEELPDLEDEDSVSVEMQWHFFMFLLHNWMLVDETAQLMANRSVYNATIEELPDLEGEDSVSDV